MADASYRLQVVGDIAQFQSEIAKIPGSTDKAAFSAAIALQKRLDKAQQDAAKSAKRASDEAAQAWERSAKGLKKFAGSVGLGGLANDVEDVVEGLGSMGSKAAIAAVGVVAIGAAALGVYKLYGAIVDASLSVEELDRKTRKYLALGPGIDRDTLESARDAKTAYDALGLTVNKIALAYGEYFLPVVKEVGLDLVEVALFTKDAVEWNIDLYESANQLVKAYTPVGVLYEKLTGLNQSYRDSAEDLVEQIQAEAAAAERLAKVNERLQRIAKSRTDALNEIVDIGRDARADQLEGYDKIEAEERAEIARLEKLAAEAGNTATIQAELAKSIAAVHKKAAKERADLDKKLADESARDAEKHHRDMERRVRERKQWAEDADKLEKEIALSRAERAAAELREYMDRLDLQIRLNEDRAKIENELRQSAAENAAADVREFLAGLEEQKQAEESRRNAYEDAMSSARDLIMQEIAAGKQATAAGKARAKAAFAIQKGLALAQIAIDTQRAVMAALADPLLLGPAKVAGVAAAITSGAAAAAIVARQKPPEVRHSGGAIDRAPDEVDVRMRRGEFVVTPQGRRALGDDELRRANAGQTHSREPIVIVQQYQHKPFAALVADNIRHVGPLRRAVRSGRLAGKVTAGFKKNNGAL
jgi:hypothetical protein